MKNIKVLLVDDQQLVREGLRRMLELDDDIKVIGEASSGEDALIKAKDLNPDVILMDIKMSGISGIEATRRIKEDNCKANIIMLTVYEDKYLAQAAEAGAVGYLLKDITQEELLRAVKVAYAGQSPVTPSVAKTLMSQFASMVQVNRKNILSRRQLEILRMVASGVTNKNIAQQLYLSEATIKRETSTIFTKLGVTDRTQAVSEAYSKNLL
jgi:two-component system, NarL family, response regulator DegU